MIILILNLRICFQFVIASIFWLFLRIVSFFCSFTCFLQFFSSVGLWGSWLFFVRLVLWFLGCIWIFPFVIRLVWLRWGFCEFVDLGLLANLLGRLKSFELGPWVSRWRWLFFVYTMCMLGWVVHFVLFLFLLLLEVKVFVLGFQFLKFHLSNLTLLFLAWLCLIIFHAFKLILAWTILNFLILTRIVK